jgi:UDP-N-acetylmuramate--alanine ligase
MVGLILIKAGIDPTVIVGGRLKDFGGTNARLGNGEWSVFEADEYDRSFLNLDPSIAIINNVELEHIDIYKDYQDVLDTFTEFANMVPFYGFVAVCPDDKGIKDILAGINKKVVTFGLSRLCDFRAENIEYAASRSTFDIIEYGEKIGRMTLSVPGEHNIRNALGAVSAARTMDIEPNVIIEALEEFTGVYRRFDMKGDAGGVTVIDDYAHHPSEVSATLNSIRKGWDRRIVCAFQPHTYTRTQSLYKDFAASFDNADVLLITDVYPAREKPIEAVTGELIAKEAVLYGHKNVHYFRTLDELQQELSDILKPGDIFITMGAGNICNAADNWLKNNK